MFGTDGRLKLSNRAFREMWQLPPEALADHPHIDALIRVCRLIAPAGRALGRDRAARSRASPTCASA